MAKANTLDYKEQKPNPLAIGQTVFDFAVHPSEDLVISGVISGKINCHRYGLEKNEHLWTEKPFLKSCRGVTFSPDGSGIYGISKEKSLVLLDINGKEIRRKTDAHENPLNSILCLNERMMATGDEQGVIKIWDNRKAEAVMVYTEHEDFIADMTFSPEHNTLVAVGGDGYLSTWDIRKPDVAAMSDHMEDELLSIALLKNGKKAVVGSQEGILSLWTWGDWGDYSDRMVGHPSSIDAICKLDEDTICTGSSDGLIRIVSILPNEFHGIIGDHGEDMPIEHIRLTHDKKYMLSSGHDETLRFWDVGHLFAEGGDEEEDQHDEEEEEEEEEDAMEAAGSGTGPGSGPKDAGSDFGDSASDDSDDSDEEKISKKRRKKQQKKQVQQKRPNKKNTSFFSDL